jgi:hypothetical protein
MLPKYLTIQSRARPAFDSLSTHEQDSVLAKFRALSETPPERWPDHGARRINDEEWPYVLRATESLVVFFSQAAGVFVIEDLVRRETLDRFFVPRKVPAGQP